MLSCLHCTCLHTASAGVSVHWFCSAAYSPHTLRSQPSYDSSILRSSNSPCTCFPTGFLHTQASPLGIIALRCLHAALQRQSLLHWLLALQGEKCLHYAAQGLRLEAVNGSVAARDSASEDKLVSPYTSCQDCVSGLCVGTDLGLHCRVPKLTFHL